MPLMPYGPEWRTSRKLAHQALSAGAVAKYHQVLGDVAALLALDISKHEEDFFDFVRM